MKHIVFGFLLMAATSFTMSAQLTVNIPDNFKVETQEDCTVQQKNVIPVITWLETAPMLTEDPSYKKARTFIMEWTTWSESVDIDLNPNVIQFSQADPDLLLYFVTGWAKHELQHPKENKIKHNTAGLNSVINYYKSQGMEGNDALETLYALQQDGKLEGWVASQVSTETEED